MAVTVASAICYPFANIRRLFNYYWGIVPILGWMAILGYYIQIVQAVVLKKKAGELPKFSGFWRNVQRGAPLFLIIALLCLAMVALRVIGEQLAFGFVFACLSFYLGFITPVLLLQYALAENFLAGFDINSASRTVFSNFWAYIATLLKILVVSLCYLLASFFVVTIVLTLPASKFSQYYLFAQFYASALKKK